MESLLNLGADEVDIRTIQSNFTVVEAGQRPMGCGVILTNSPNPSPDDVELSMPEMRERYRRHRVHPDLPWTSGEVYAVAVHWRRGDIVNPASSRGNSYRRGVVSEEQLIFAMEVMRKAVMHAGENHGQEIIFHVFTQGKADCCYKLSTRKDTILHIAAETNVQHAVPPRVGEELRLAFHSLVMADALLAGNSALSTAASWLSRGWIWAFQHKAGGKMPPNSTLFNWNDAGVVEVASIQAPRWRRPAPGPPPRLKKAPFGEVRGGR